MKSRTSLLICFTFLVLGTTGAIAMAQTAEQQEQMRKMREQAMPGPEHETLAKLIGAWNAQMHAPGQPEAIASGSARGETIMEGRFVDLTLEFGAGAAASKLRYTLGFDRRHDEYTLSLIDMAGTYAVHARGVEQGGVIRLHGTDDDPYMKSLGLEKAFVFDLSISDDRSEIVLYFVDTRIEERPLREAYRYTLER